MTRRPGRGKNLEVIMEQKTILSAMKPRRVLIVDDDRDGADALGLLLEELGNEVHVTYSGTQALDVATAFRADLLLIDLVMPEMDGCDLARQFRQIATFAKTKIVAVTGHKDAEHAALAMKAGFDSLLLKPVPLKELKALLDGIVVTDRRRTPRKPSEQVSLGPETLLPIREARRIRSERSSKSLTQAESQAAICDGIIRFEEEYMGRKPEQFHAHFVKDLLVVRIQGALTQAERQLGNSSSPEKGRDLIKQVRKQLLETARPMLESLVHEVTGVKASSMHHDISTVTGEEVVLFSLVKEPYFGS
jgi:CheY-like chemotaxis protein